VEALLIAERFLRNRLIVDRHGCSLRQAAET